MPAGYSLAGWIGLSDWVIRLATLNKPIRVGYRPGRPYVRGELTWLHDPDHRAALDDFDLEHNAAAVCRAIYARHRTSC